MGPDSDSADGGLNSDTFDPATNDTDREPAYEQPNTTVAITNPEFEDGLVGWDASAFEANDDGTASATMSATEPLATLQQTVTVEENESILTINLRWEAAENEHIAIFVDGERVFAAGGANDWMTFSKSIAAGEHDIRIAYIFDETMDSTGVRGIHVDAVTLEMLDE